MDTVTSTSCKSILTTLPYLYTKSRRKNKSYLLLLPNLSCNFGLWREFLLFLPYVTIILPPKKTTIGQNPLRSLAFFCANTHQDLNEDLTQKKKINNNNEKHLFFNLIFQSLQLLARCNVIVVERVCFLDYVYFDHQYYSLGHLSSFQSTEVQLYDGTTKS